MHAWWPHERAPRDLEKSRHGQIEGGGCRPAGWSVVTITRTGVGQSGSEEGAGAREFGGFPIDTPRFPQRNSTIPWTTTSNSPQPSPLSLRSPPPAASDARQPSCLLPTFSFTHGDRRALARRADHAKWRRLSYKLLRAPKPTPSDPLSARGLAVLPGPHPHPPGR